MGSVQLRAPRLAVDGWSACSGTYKRSLAKHRASTYACICNWITTRGGLPTPSELVAAMGFKVTELAVMRFRIYWRDFVLLELPRLERARVLTYAQVLTCMRAAATMFPNKSKTDTKLREARLLWFCSHVLEHTELPVTNRILNQLAFGGTGPNLPAEHYGRLVRLFRERHLAPLLAALSRIPVSEIVNGPTERAAALLRRIDRLWGRVPAAQARDIYRAVCDHIVETEAAVPTYERVRNILTFVPPNNAKSGGFMPLLREWRKDRGFPPTLRGNMKAALPRTWDSLIPTLSPEVREAPHTFLDPRASPGRYRRPHDEVAAFLGRCEDLTIRSSLTIAVLNGSGNHARLPMFSESLHQIMSAGRLSRLSDAGMEDTLRAFVTGDLLLPEEPDDSGDSEDIDPRQENSGASGHSWSSHKLKDFFRTYRTVTFAQQRYLALLTVDQRASMAPYLLPRLTDQVFWRAANFNRLSVDAQKRRRKARTDALFPQRGLIRILPEFRTNLASRIRTAFRIAVAKAESGAVTLPHEFSIHEKEPHLGPPTLHRFHLWSRSALLKRHRIKDPRNPAHRKQYFVEYLGARGDDGEASTNELWFADLVRFNRFHRGHLVDAASAHFAQSYGINGNQYKSLWVLLCGNRPLAMALSALTSHVRQTDSSYRPVFFSPEGLFQMCLYGRAANRILNVTGCRANELQQIYASRECLVRVDLESTSPAYAFMAIPKLGQDLEPFFIDELCVRFIGELAECLKRNSSAGQLPKVLGAQNLAPHKRVLPRPYIFQLVGASPHALRDEEIGGLVRFMLHGITFALLDGSRFQPGLHDLRHLTGTTLRSQGVPLDVIGKMMKHKDLKVTDYYSEPTTSMVIAAMHGLQLAVVGVGPTSGVRQPSELEQQLKEANGTVGAVTNVLGGKCGVASPCAAKFACPGCAGLIPDPAQRAPMQRKKERLLEDLDAYAKQGMLAEVRKAEAYLRDCDRVLAEMDLQEAAINDASAKGADK